MNFNLPGVVAVVLGLGAFHLTYHFLRPRNFSVRFAVFCASSLLSIPALIFAAYYLHVLPEQTWLYTLRAARGSEFLVVFLGCSSGAAAALLPRIAMVPLLLVYVLLAAGPYLKPILKPVPDEAFSENWYGGICLQSTASTCGPASVCTVLKQFGVQTSEREAARAAFSYLDGTEAWYLARYVRSKGLEARFDLRDGFSPSVGLPAIVGVRLGGVGHFIAVLGLNGDEVKFADPMIGEEHLTLAQFQARYAFTGFHMVISKP